MAASAQTYEQVMMSLRQGQYKPVYLLYGDEPYYIDRVTEYVEDHILDEAAKAFDQVTLYGKDLPDGSIAEAVMQARGFAMFGGMKVVIVREAQTLTKWDALNAYLAAPQPQSILLIAYKKTSAPSVKDSPNMVQMQSVPLRDYQVAGWITRYIENWNREQKKQPGEDVTIDPRVAQILADHLGTNLSQIVLSLQKLVDGRPAGKNIIDAELVERNVGISKDFNNFALQEALKDGDVVKANRIVRYFASSKDHPIQKELPILFTFFANLMLYHYLPDKTNERAVAAALKINPFTVKNYAIAARRFSAGKTFRIISYFRETDARSKGIGTGSATELDLWKELIYKILH